MTAARIHPAPTDDVADSLGVPLQAEEFRAFQALIQHACGISLADSKRYLLASRLTGRLRELQLPSFAAYYQRITTQDPEGTELRQLINCITTNKTDFFRESHHFEFLTRELLVPLRERARRGGPRRLRLWSAGCSTGEEPYSLAMTVAEALGDLSGWDVRILASDIDTEVLAHASAGVYRSDRLTGLSEPMRARWLRPVDSEHFVVVPELRRLVAFRRINFVAPDWPIRTQFDAAFCRNVVIYFDRSTQRQLFTRLAQAIVPGGWLMIGHSESLHWLPELFEAQHGTVYRVRGAGDAAGAPVAAAAPVAAPATPQSPAPAPAMPVYRIVIGGVHAADRPVEIRTVLGSCIAACLFDPVTGIGGMNHFLLPEGQGRELATYGVHAMEILINAIMKLGGDRRRLLAKVFGGAHVLADSSSDVPQRNVEFIRNFLALERIPVAAERLGGTAPLEVRFRPHEGRALVRVVQPGQLDHVLRQEARFGSARGSLRRQPPGDDVTLF